MIYFIACPEADAVKIGVTRDFPTCVWKRLTTMQTGCPLKLELLGTMEGGYVEEAALLALHADARIHGEWFRMTDQLRKHCSTLTVPERPSRPARSEKLVRVWA